MNRFLRLYKRNTCKYIRENYKKLVAKSFVPKCGNLVLWYFLSNLPAISTISLGLVDLINELGKLCSFYHITHCNYITCYIQYYIHIIHCNYIIDTCYLQYYIHITHCNYITCYKQYYLHIIHCNYVLRNRYNTL